MRSNSILLFRLFSKRYNWIAHSLLPCQEIIKFSPKQSTPTKQLTHPKTIFDNGHVYLEERTTSVPKHRERMGHMYMNHFTTSIYVDFLLLPQRIQQFSGKHFSSKSIDFV